MPTSVIVAVAAEYIGAAVAGSVLAGAAIGAVSFVTYAGIAAAASFIAGAALNNVLRGSGGKNNVSGYQSAAQQAQARTQMIRSPSAVRQIIYGEVMASGALVFAASSTDNSKLHLVIAIAGHEVEAIGTFYLNDKAVGTLDGAGAPIVGSQFYGLATFKIHLGSTTQTVDADLFAERVGWGAFHRLRGVAYVYVKLTYDKNQFATGIPNVRCVVKGKKIYDPRTTLTAYSNNAALVAYDYLNNYLGAATAEIDAASFISAANICDEAVALAAGGTESRYTANGVILTDTKHRDAMHSILSASGGALTCPQGSYRLDVAAYTAPVIAWDEDILRAPIRVRASVSKKDLFNAVKGQFISPSNYWQGADFPPVKNTTYATDDGAEIFQDIQLPFTTSGTTAQRLARIMLEKSRQGITVEMPCKLSAIKVRPFENITLTIDHLGWSAKVFKVITTKLSDNGGVDLMLQEEASGVYDWSASETTHDVAPNTNLPNPFSVGMCGNVQMAEELYETTGSAGVRSKATLSWAAPEDAFVVDYEVEYKLSSSGTWMEIFDVRGTQYEFYDLAPASYDFRVKARNIMGVVGEYTPAKTFIVYGLTAAPTNVAGFSVKALTGMALATWNRTTDLDVKIGGDVVIRWSPLTTGAAWNDGVVLPDGSMNGDATSAYVPLANGTYMAKFVDSTGHYSDVAATAVIDVAPLVHGWTTIATSTQHSAFSGAKTNVFFSSTANAIELDGTTLIDDWGAIDELSFIDSIGGVASTGTYEFDTTMDLTTAGTRRFHAHIKAQGYLDNDYVDDHSEPIDSWQDIDGGELNDVNATVYCRASDDDITYRPWTPFMVADFYGRYFQFKALLSSGDVTHNIHVYELSVAAKVLT